MRIQGIVHQNIVQLKWYILACLGLVMALPIENTIISIITKEEPYYAGITITAVMITPLLAGLLACVNVQSDLDDKRYIFWRSKPVNIKFILIIKYFVGLLVSFFIIICPFIFGIFSAILTGEKIEYDGSGIIILLLFLVSTMTYSLCFGANIFIRNTARAWLIGMLVTGFFFIIPFLLPLNFRDYNLLFDLRSMLIIAPVATISFFVLSLYAAQHDWHLKTNLKSLLWVIAGIVFVLFMLFSSQVANIKVLEEKEVEPLNKFSSQWNSQEYRWKLSANMNVDDINNQKIWDKYPLDYDGDNVVFRSYSYIDIENNSIVFSDIKGYSGDEVSSEDFSKYKLRRYPYDNGRLLKTIDGKLYGFEINNYYQKVGEIPNTEIQYEKATINCYKFTGESWILVGELDISECIETDNPQMRLAMRLVGNMLFAFVNKSFVEVDVTHPEELKIINTTLNAVNTSTKFKPWENPDVITVPIIQTDLISVEEKIKLSIDYFYYSPNMYESSIVDIYEGKITFFPILNNNKIMRTEVVKYDDEYIYCKYTASRSATILEEKLDFGYTSYDSLVKNGKFYLKGRCTLMVFDIRSGTRIRKLGHFVRMNQSIHDMAVAENGNILLYMSLWNDLKNKDDILLKQYLCLLESP